MSTSWAVFAKNRYVAARVPPILSEARQKFAPQTLEIKA